jgi:hypothetical protein
MSDHRNQKKGQNKPTKDPKSVIQPAHDMLVKIPQPLTVRQESTAEDNAQYTEEKESREAQLRTAQCLNQISFGLAIIGLLSILAVYLQIEQNKSTFKAQQRAWVMVDSIVMVGDDGKAASFSTDQPTIFLISVKNGSPSPALDVVFDFHLNVPQVGPCAGPHYHSPDRGSANLAPGSYFQNADNRIGPVPQDCINSIRQGETHIGIVGTISYQTIFKDGIHTTRFCDTYSAFAGHMVAGKDCDYAD